MSWTFWAGLAASIVLVGLVWWGANEVCKALDRSETDGAED